MARPVIIIPASEDGKSIPRKLQVNRPYADAIESAGGIALIVARPKTNDALDAIIRLADGLLLLGGHDVNPLCYNENDRGCVGVDDERDALEFALFRRAMEKKISVLGICRGMQLINVTFGGTLYHDLIKEMPGALEHDHHYHNKALVPRDYPAHNVDVAKGTLLHQLVGVKMLSVNSLHHQGTKTLGKNLLASAHAPDGLIEAIEMKNYPFMLGVQWHPEELRDEVSEKIFSAFIATANK